MSDGIPGGQKALRKPPYIPPKLVLPAQRADCLIHGSANVSWLVWASRAGEIPPTLACDQAERLTSRQNVGGFGGECLQSKLGRLPLDSTPLWGDFEPIPTCLSLGRTRKHHLRETGSQIMRRLPVHNPS